MLQLFYDSRQCASDHLKRSQFVYHRLISDETGAGVGPNKASFIPRYQLSKYNLRCDVFWRISVGAREGPRITNECGHVTRDQDI